MAMEVIVIDNHSTDGSREYLQPLFPDVKFYWNNENLGFAKACNWGLEQAKGDYILFLNPDTIVAEDCFTQCMHFFRIHENTGVLGVRMLDESGKFLKESKRAFPSPLPSLFKLTGLARLFPHSAFFAKYYLGHLNEHQTHQVDVVAGAFMMIKKNVLEIAGSFDEAFFMYGEDIDLSFRIQKEGFKNYYYHDVTILHFKGRSTQKDTVHYVKMFYKAMSIFAKKHYGNSRRGIYHFIIQCGIWIRSAVAAMPRRLMLGTVHNSKKRRLMDSLPIMVIGDEASYQIVAQILRAVDKKIGESVVRYKADPYAVGAEHIFNNNKVGAIVFCEGQQSFQQIIEQIERLPGKHTKIAIHATGSRGIAGFIPE